jgi:hypothetical protein
MTEATELKACVNCENHFESYGIDYCALHRLTEVNYVKGIVIKSPFICAHAREQDSLCGPNAKDYVHRGPEPSPSLWVSFKESIKALFLA